MDEVRTSGGRPDRPRFSCTLCGDCCTGNQVVRLCGGDLDLLVHRLGLVSALALRTEGLVRLVAEPSGLGQTLWRPRIRFRTRPLVQCPFLVNDVADDGTYRGLCSLHPGFKPLVCALSPLARAVDDPGSGPVSETWTFVPPVEGCPGVGRGHPMDVWSPPGLRDRLEGEVRWMRDLVEASPGCQDEDEAWDLIASLAGGPS